MCHFITGIIDESTELEALNSIGSNFDITFGHAVNDHIQRQLKPGMKYLVKHSGQCDCGTALAARIRVDEIADSKAKNVKRFKNKGWSDTKIQKWLDNKQRSEANDERSFDPGRGVGKYRIDALNWLSFLRAVEESERVNFFGILLHMYVDGVETENVRLMDFVALQPNDMTEDSIYDLREDTVYQLSK